jgi:transitional endoplasmic reticulum ATPase
MKTRRPSARSHTVQDMPLGTALWILRLLVPLGGHKELIGGRGFSNDTLATALGLGEWVDPEDYEFDPVSVRTCLRALHRDAEREHAAPALPPTLRANVARLGSLVGMTDTECRLLEFATLLHHERLLDEAADTLGHLSTLKMVDVLASVLALPAVAIRTALLPQGVLARSGLLNIDRSGNAQLRGKLDLLSGKFADFIVGTEADPITLLRDTVAPSAPARLTLADFAHLEQVLLILRPYLEHALVSGRPGVNIFVHGAPGTGKTELVRALAGDLKCELFEVASEDDDGDPVNGERRLRAFRAAQSFFDRRRALILFDEVEDVFNDGDNFLSRKSTAQRRKAWLNRTLEQNAVPTLWLSNSIDGIDPAFMRRFDMVLELPIPPRSQRERILRQTCGDLVDATTLTRIAHADALAPAVVERVASVVRSIRKGFDADGAARAVEWLIDQTLEAQGHAPLRATSACQLPLEYDPTLLNTDVDLIQLGAGLARTRSARLCLYGPPGTGKSAYGRWLADQLGMPLLMRRASDLLSKWVGDSEKNIAAAFRQAEREGALLLIDEVDSFLRERSGAGQSWEVTRVNEMLTQMECFSGVFIASTNLMDGLDQAALRRFDLKLHFGFLLPAQAELLLGRYCASLGLGLPAPQDGERVRRQGKLTPGDFAAVARQHRFRPLENSAELVRALEQECTIKQGPATGMGFLS